MDAKKESLRQIETYSTLLGSSARLSDEEVRIYWQENIKTRPLALDTFYTILDYRVPGFTYSHGIPEILGVSEDLKILSYLDRVHPAMLQLYTIWGREALELAIQYKDQLEPFKYTYRVAFPILHGNGSYYSVIQNSTILQIDEHKQMVSQLNTFRMGIAFHEVDIQNLKGEIFSEGVSSQKWNEVFLENISQKILKAFTRKENELLRSYAAGFHKPGDIIKKHHITIQTLYTHHKNILKKSMTYFFADLLV